MLVVVGVHTGDALMGGRGRNPQIAVCRPLGESLADVEADARSATRWP